MSYPIQECSPKAREKLREANPCRLCDGSQLFYGDSDLGPCQCAVNVGIQETTDKYPFVSLQPGKCFTVPFADAVEKTIRNRISKQNTVDERKYCVVKHTEFECYEVVRVK